MRSDWTWRRLDDAATSVPELIRALNQRFQPLSAALAYLTGAAQAVGGFSVGATTPSVAGASLWTADNPALTTITAFTGGVPGQSIIVWATTANTTLAHSAALRLKGGVNVTLTATEARTFATVNGTDWRET